MNEQQTQASDAVSHPRGAAQGRDPGAPLDTLVVGAGFAGICVGHALAQRGRGPFLIVDKASGVGGTWWHNRYPGATCDVASHLYCFSFAPNPRWSHRYAPQAEIQAYLERCVQQFGLSPQLRLGVRVRTLRFDPERRLWRAQMDGMPDVWARFVVNASGGLHKPHIPDIPGQSSFTGEQMHTAAWNEDYDFRDKRVAIIGSAASAIQVLPRLAEQARRVTLFQRTPNYIARRDDFAFDERQMQRFERHPLWARAYRELLFWRSELLLWPVITTRFIRERISSVIMGAMKQQVVDPELRASLRPRYQLGCKRILISDDFYPALQRDHVRLITRAPDRLQADSVCIADGEAVEADVIVYATGFDIAGHWGDIEIQGPYGRLADAWSECSAAYRGVMVAGFPNLFMTTGPNTGVGTTSVVYMIEHAVGYIMQCLELAGESGEIEVRAEAQQRYNEELQRALAKTVWASDCPSWYKRADGLIETLYPHAPRRWAQEMRHVNRADMRLSHGAGV